MTLFSNLVTPIRRVVRTDLLKTQFICFRVVYYFLLSLLLERLCLLLLTGTFRIGFGWSLYLDSDSIGLEHGAAELSGVAGLQLQRILARRSIEQVDDGCCFLVHALRHTDETVLCTRLFSHHDDRQCRSWHNVGFNVLNLDLQ